MQAFVGYGGEAVQPSAQVKRMEFQGETYVSLSDMVYLCDVSRERHLIEGSAEKADMMAELTFVLDMMLRV